MKRENKVIAFLKNPSLIFLVIWCLITVAAVVSAILLTTVTSAGAVAYAVYVLAAVSLAYSVYLVVHYAKYVKTRIKEAANKREITRKFMENYGFRTVVFACVTFAVNTGYAIFYGVLGIISRSLWYGALAGYYIFLSAVRCWVLIGGRRASKSAKGDKDSLYIYKLKIFRGCGIFLIVLDVALATAVAQMVMSDSPAAHGEIAAIASAAYAFYKITLACINLFKAKRGKDPLVQSLRNISFTDALVSMLALQTTLVALYSEGESSMMALNIITGAVVCAATVGMGIFMAVRASVLLRRKARGERSEEESQSGLLEEEIAENSVQTAEITGPIPDKNEERKEND